jgi:hypothetical protein
MVEGTLAGIAAGVTALNASKRDDFARQVSRIEIKRGQELVDISLVDVVVSKPAFIASRAIWDVSSVKEIFLARADPGTIGFSSIGGHLSNLPFSDGKGVHITVGPGKLKVMAPIAPGLIRWVPIKSYRVFGPGEDVAIQQVPAVIALDGEREHFEKRGNQTTVRLNPKGPWVVDVSRALGKASAQRLFINSINKEVG